MQRPCVQKFLSFTLTLGGHYVLDKEKALR